MAAPPGLVTISYAELASPAADLSGAIEAAFGPSGLGLILVEGVPGYVAARAALLPLATQLAQLPAAELSKLEDASSKFNFGWSHGKETLAGGQAGAEAGGRWSLAGARAVSDTRVRELTPAHLQTLPRAHSTLTRS